MLGYTKKALPFSRKGKTKKHLLKQIKGFAFVLLLLKRSKYGYHYVVTAGPYGPLLPRGHSPLGTPI